MLELIVLGMIGVVLFAGTVVLLTILKILVRLVLLPLLLIKWLVAGVVFVALGPILLLVGLFVAFVVGASLLVPLTPFLLAAGLIWLLVRANRRPLVA
jgi:hypothetical protein